MTEEDHDETGALEDAAETPSVDALYAIAVEDEEFRSHIHIDEEALVDEMDAADVHLLMLHKHIADVAEAGEMEFVEVLEGVLDLHELILFTE